jgi:DNA-directed RNA polymerase subunit beta
MSKILANNHRYRRTFTKTPPAIDVDNLIAIQLKSYEQFLQKGVDHDDRTDTGLQAVFKSVFPISDFSNRARLHFKHYDLQAPSNDVDEVRARGQTYAAQLKVTVEMKIYNINPETGEQEYELSQSQPVFFGDIPLMTEHGTFVINGTERVVVSQLHRSPGVFF